VYNEKIKLTTFSLSFFKEMCHFNQPFSLNDPFNLKSETVLVISRYKLCNNYEWKIIPPPKYATGRRLPLCASYFSLGRTNSFGKVSHHTLKMFAG